MSAKNRRNEKTLNINNLAWLGLALFLLNLLSSIAFAGPLTDEFNQRQKISPAKQACLAERSKDRPR